MAEQPDPITDECGCNQPGAVHQRGDEGFCRSAADRIAAAIDWNPTCLPGQERRTIVDQVLRLVTLGTSQEAAPAGAQASSGRWWVRRVDELDAIMGSFDSRERAEETAKMLRGYGNDVIVTPAEPSETTVAKPKITFEADEAIRRLGELSDKIDALSRQHAGRPGDRVIDGGQEGTLVRCHECSGDGLLVKLDDAELERMRAVPQDDRADATGEQS